MHFDHTNLSMLGWHGELCKILQYFHIFFRASITKLSFRWLVQPSTAKLRFALILVINPTQPVIQLFAAVRVVREWQGLYKG